MESAVTGYESPSWWYDLRGFFILKLAYRGSLLRQVRFFGAGLGPRHLEAAIGSGTLFQMVLWWRALQRRPSVEVFGFDYAETMLAGARRRFGRKANIKLQIADVHRLNFEDGSFDSVNVANAIHCFSKIEIAMAELYRVLKPGGKLSTNVLLYPTGLNVQRWIANRINAWGKAKGILYTPYHAAEFVRIAGAAGFQVESQETIGNGLYIVLRK